MYSGIGILNCFRRHRTLNWDGVGGVGTRVECGGTRLTTAALGAWQGATRMKEP